MKVLIATGLYPPDIGGPATYATMLETELPARGIDVEVIPFLVVRKYPKGSRHLVYTFKVFWAAGSSDVVYALDSISVGLPAWMASLLRRRPFLVRLGGDYAWEQGRQRFGITQTLDEYTHEPDWSHRMVRVLARIQRFVVNRAKRVIVPSKYLGSIVASWGVSKEQIKVIYSALSPIEVTESKDQLREQFGYTQPILVTIGRLVPWKGMEALIEVVESLKDEFQDITLLIIGDGPDEQKLKAQVLENGLSENVHFLGPLKKNDLGKYLKAADVFVLNTAYEGLSHQLLEAMQLRVPVVTTAVGGNPELITDEREGLLVPYNDVVALKEAVRRQYNDSNSAERMVEAAAVKTADFSKKRLIPKLVEVFNKVASS